jgi:hypothetical protein
VIFVKVLHAQSLLTTIETLLFGSSYINNGSLLSIGFSGRLRGLKSEPSMYGFALFLFFVQAIVIYRKYKLKKYKNYAIIALLLMILSKSFTAVVCILGIGIYWFISEYKRSKSKPFLIMCGLSVFTIVMFSFYYIYTHDFSSYYLKRIHMALVNMEDLSITGWTGNYATLDGSTKVRMISIVGTLEYFINRPIFGLALGSTYAHSTMATVISSVGVVGTYAWGKFTFFSIKNVDRYYILATIIWCFLLVILDNGLFPFYGLENLVVIYTLQNFTEERGYLHEKNKNSSGIFASIP